MPSPSPMNRHCARSVSRPRASLGYHVSGTVIVRPSTRSTTKESSVIRTPRARASPTSIGDTEVFIPFLHQEEPIRQHQSFHVAQFGRSETSAARQAHRIEPELRTVGVPLDMDVNRLIPIRRIKEEPV